MINNLFIYLTRGVGTGAQGGQAPQVLPSALFPGESALFLREKCLKDCVFLPKGTFENLNLCYFPENFFHFRKNMIYSGKI